MKLQILDDSNNILSEGTITKYSLFAAGVAMGIGSSAENGLVKREMVEPVLKIVTEVNLKLHSVEGGRVENEKI